MKQICLGTIITLYLHLRIQPKHLFFTLIQVIVNFDSVV